MFCIGNVILFQPDIEEEFADEAVNAGFVRIPAGNIDALFQGKEDVEEPRHIGVEEILAHDEHVEHVSPGAVHDAVEGKQVVRIAFLDDGFRNIEAFLVVGMVIMRAVRFDVVAAFPWDDDGAPGEDAFPVSVTEDLLPFLFYTVYFFPREIAAVMDETDVVGVKVFPGPIKACELAEMRVLP